MLELMPKQFNLISIARKSSSTARARLRRATIQRILPIFVLALGVVGMPTLLLSSGGLGRLGRLKSEHKTVELEISRLAKRVEYLRVRADSLKDDPTAIERSARDQLGLVRRTEVVFHFQSSER